MSQMHRTVESIMAMIERKWYTESDIISALADLEAMNKNISDNAYRNTKRLLEDILRDMK